MKVNRTVLFLTIIISILSIYYLSFTIVDYNVQHKAEQQAMNVQGRIDFDQKQSYLVKIWKEPVYRLFGLDYSYEEIKERSLKLGLDLQGGMHVTLEISPIELVKGLASNDNNTAFLESLQWAQQEKEKGVQASFGQLFVTAYKRIAPNENVKTLFITTQNKDRAYHFSNEQDVIKTIDLEIEKAVKRSLTIVRSRLDKFGTFQPNIQQLPGTSRIQIELPGVTSPQRVRKLLQGVAQLRFYEVAAVDLYAKSLQAIDTLLLKEEQAQIEQTLSQEISKEEKEKIMPTQSILSRLSSYPFPYGFVYSAEVIAQIKAIFSREDIKPLLPSQIVWLWDRKAHTTQDGKEAFSLYPIKLSRDKKPLLEGNIITNAAQGFDENGGKPIVSMQMNSEGALMWKKITADNIGKRVAIVLDDQVYSAPTINQEIPNGHSQISGNFSLEEAKDLASVLQTGSLPAPLKIVEEAIIGPSLGKLSQRSGIMATAIGLGLILCFMVLYYGKGGMVANVALCLNLLFIVGTFAQLDATLTLPGIAGLVLTIGMSIDANVLIFERIKEELQNKVHIKEAIKRGYQKSYSSIVDSNITTFLTGMILYYFGQGQVRGFAVILMIGIISSIFTSIWVTQLIFSYLVNRVVVPKLTFSCLINQACFKNMQFNFVKNRFYFYVFSLSLIVIGAFCCYQQKGLALGVDFAGGRSYIVQFIDPVDSSALKEKLAPHLEGRVEVRTYGANNVMQITTSYVAQQNGIEIDKIVRHKLVEGLKDFMQFDKRAKDGFKVMNSAKVGAAVAKDVQKSGKRALIFALLGVFLYVVLRFSKWSFGLAAVLALVHDVCVVIAGFCIARVLGCNYEVNEVFLAAVLTIIGYSINDTIVIFDRIREQLKQKKVTIEQTFVNCSIKGTLSRTLITSFTTLLAVLMLFFFGGEALRGFSFALLLGILFGTYSSICIAAPLLTDLSIDTFKNEHDHTIVPTK